MKSATITRRKGQAIASAAMGEQIFGDMVGLDGVSFDMTAPPVCTQLNASMCSFTESMDMEGLLVAVYNPLSRSQDVRIKLPVPNDKTTMVPYSRYSILAKYNISCKQWAFSSGL